MSNQRENCPKTESDGAAVMSDESSLHRSTSKTGNASTRVCASFYCCLSSSNATFPSDSTVISLPPCSNLMLTHFCFASSRKSSSTFLNDSTRHRFISLSTSAQHSTNNTPTNNNVCIGVRCVLNESTERFNGQYSSSSVTPIRATEHHLPYGVSVTCYLKQVNTPRLKPSQRG